MEFGVNLAGLQLEHPIMNAAGTCKRAEDVEKLANSAAAAIMVGSGTMAARTGNEGNVYEMDPVRGAYSLNSLGLPNPGRLYYEQELPRMTQTAHDAGKPLIFSGAGFSPEEYVILGQVADAAGVDVYEANLGCPNVWDGGKQKRIASFEPTLVREIVLRLQTVLSPRIRLVLKVSPFSDPVLLEQIAIEAQSGRVAGVARINAFANGFGLRLDGNRLITPGDGLAGLAGPALKPIGLGQVKQWRKLLPETITVIGIGGISTGCDVWEYQQVGAGPVAIATAYANRGEKVFSQILQEYVDTVEQKAEASV